MTDRGTELATTSAGLAREHDVVMLDLDGVVYVGGTAVDGAADALRAVRADGVPSAYITNNASRPASAVAESLRALRMPCESDDDVVTSGQAVARLVAEAVDPGSRVLVVGGPGLAEPLTQHGLDCVTTADGVAAVVQGYHPAVGWQELAEASYAIQAGAQWFASNTDRTVPTDRGVAPGNGALVEVVATATGRRPLVAGKPEPALFEETIARTGAQRPLMVGDRPDTDIDGANRAGIDSLLVLTGVCTIPEVFALSPGRRPRLVAADLSGLTQVHRHVEVGEGRAVCASAVAEMVDGAIEVTSGGGLDALRAAVALAWSTQDRDGVVAGWSGTMPA